MHACMQLHALHACVHACNGSWLTGGLNGDREGPFEPNFALHLSSRRGPEGAPNIIPFGNFYFFFTRLRKPQVRGGPPTAIHCSAQLATQVVALLQQQRQLGGPPLRRSQTKSFFYSFFFYSLVLLFFLFFCCFVFRKWKGEGGARERRKPQLVRPPGRLGFRV